LFSLFKTWRNRTRVLDTYLIEYLQQTYKMSDADITKLEFVTGTEQIASKSVALFRVYDPAKTKESPDKMTFAGLNSQRETILFEGRFAKNGNISEIKDLRRQMKA
jgi:hypothetical protein